MPSATFTLRFNLTGWHPDQPVERFRQAAGVALYQLTEFHVAPRAVELCPVDTGALRASKQVYPAEFTRGRIRVRFGFGNASVSYAAAVHENLTARHTVGQAKFAERAMTETVPVFVPMMTALMRPMLSGQGI
jgi:hypothetical protein